MNFASYDFWRVLFFCFVISQLFLSAAGRLVPAFRQSLDKLCLLATAMALLASESVLTLGMLLWVVLLGWFCILLQGARWHRGIKGLVFVMLLLAQLGPLFYYKYSNFALNEVLGFSFRNPSVLIPMGLSFYTFQTIGFWVDNLRDPKPRPSFMDYLNFSSFFPQIVAGPIEKRESLLPQIEQVSYSIHPEKFESALKWIILGLAYKLTVADNIGSLSSQYRVDSANAWQVWFECFSFGMRIYFDFAGYSFIAVGLGLLFGIKLTLNFRSPYWSSNLRDFWRNWHVSLGAWLRDYVYLPLGGRRSSRWILNVLIVFIVSGIWHGAGWGFLVWGLLHGLGVAFCGLKKGKMKFGWLGGLVTFIYVTAAWLFFFESDPETMKYKAIALIDPSAYGLNELRNVLQIFPGKMNAVTTALVLSVGILFLAVEGIGVLSKREPYFIFRKPAFSLLLVILTVFIAPLEESSFIYFNF